MKKAILPNVYKTVIAFLCLAVSLPLIAADTGQINYQARLLDSYGRRVNDTVDLSFKIYDAVSDGNLLWSETQAGVVVEDGVYSVVLGSQTNIPASVFVQNNVYLELGINGETMSPRQQITASAYSLVARTVMGSNIFENQDNGDVGIGTQTPAAKLDVKGTVQATGLKIPTGATHNYVLVSDSEGVGTWQSVSVVITEVDPIHTNWVRTVFTPVMADIGAATNDMWNRPDSGTSGGINARVLASTYNVATDALWGAVGNLQAATNDMWNAAGGINARVLRAGDGMTGALTNLVGFVGNGFNLTNIPDSSLVGSTNYVKKTGDTMTGALSINNNLAVSGAVTMSNKVVYVPSNEVVVAGTAIGSSQAVKIIRAAGDIVMNVNPPIAAGSAGQTITLIYDGTDVHSITLTNCPNLKLAGCVSFTLKANDVIQFIWDGVNWIEVHRADNTEILID